MAFVDETSAAAGAATGRVARGAARAVLIDVGGVLRSDRTREVLADWAVRLGTSPRKVLRAVFGGNDEAVLVGRMSEDDWWGIVAERLRLRPDEVSDLRADMGARETWNTGLLEALRTLRAGREDPERRVAVAIVSNAWPVVGTILAREGMAGIADEIVLSCEVGFAKPDPRIFELTLRRLGVAAGDALFIDDTPANVDAARRLGLDGHVHTGNRETVARIEAFGALA
ncbi:HAD family hydrolase [Actinomadura rupiterrae]|uniref:HAD family hydrolase n=1 Tax=Actinomadura rupiterrae TaxID=559627 RepID=UPI0020A44838|nr:HAD family phosphatase [Actinomadura rupiterrae]MCP2339930.1 putative hydrolase of the HAD superfamily [Actinomadura rupiterrae]